MRTIDLPDSDVLLDHVRSEDMTLEAAKTLVVKVMSKSLDSTNLSAEKRKSLRTEERVNCRQSAAIPACTNQGLCWAHAQSNLPRSRGLRKARCCTRCPRQRR